MDPVYFTFPDVKKIGVCDKSRLPLKEKRAKEKGKERERKRATTRRQSRLKIPADSSHCVTKHTAWPVILDIMTLALRAMNSPCLAFMYAGKASQSFLISVPNSFH